METEHEILINSSLVTHGEIGESYEFILNSSLCVVECVKVDSIAHGIISPIENAEKNLNGMLFELNHVRVNPRVDNSVIIQTLTEALQRIGVNVNNSPEQNSIAVTFKPLGEISDNVRFYIGSMNKVTFLSPATRPKLVTINEKKRMKF